MMTTNTKNSSSRKVARVLAAMAATIGVLLVAVILLLAVAPARDRMLSMAIGMTVVAFGTSAPELAVNGIAAWRGRGKSAASAPNPKRP